MSFPFAFYRFIAQVPVSGNTRGIRGIVRLYSIHTWGNPASTRREPSHVVAWDGVCSDYRGVTRDSVDHAVVLQRTSVVQF